MIHGELTLLPRSQLDLRGGQETGLERKWEEGNVPNIIEALTSLVLGGTIVVSK